jgi:hypothetical protein
MTIKNNELKKLEQGKCGTGVFKLKIKKVLRRPRISAKILNHITTSPGISRLRKKECCWFIGRKKIDISFI